MNQSFDLNTFLHCPQGPRLEGEARADACRVLGAAIKKGQVMTAARLLMQDPSLITERVGENPLAQKNAVKVAIDAGLDVFVLFALAHGMPVTSPAFGAPGGLLEVAVKKKSQTLVSCALLYRADPNQINKKRNRSLLTDIFNVACEATTDSWDLVNASWIVRMLLDAGADPWLPCGADTTIFSRCLYHFPRHNAFVEIFTEALKRSSNVRDLQIKGMPIVEFAAHVPTALKLLIKAGAYVDTDKLFPILESRGLSGHIPDINDLIQYRDADKSESSRGQDSLHQETPLNLAPNDFLSTQQGPRLTGNARATGCHLLNMAIRQGRFVTATKILAQDPSLITESIGEDDTKKRPAVKVAIDSGMTSLVPFALAQGISPDDPAFGASNGLLGAGIRCGDQTLVSYALLDHADPNRLYCTNGSQTENGQKSFLDHAIDEITRGVEVKY